MLCQLADHQWSDFMFCATLRLICASPHSWPPPQAYKTKAPSLDHLLLPTTSQTSHCTCSNELFWTSHNVHRTLYTSTHSSATRTEHTLESTERCFNQFSEADASGDKKFPFIARDKVEAAMLGIYVMHWLTLFVLSGLHKEHGQTIGVSRKDFRRLLLIFFVPLTRFEASGGLKWKLWDFKCLRLEMPSKPRCVIQAKRKNFSGKHVSGSLASMSLSFTRNGVNGMANRKKQFRTEVLLSESISLSSLHSFIADFFRRAAFFFCSSPHGKKQSSCLT